MNGNGMNRREFLGAATVLASILISRPAWSQETVVGAIDCHAHMPLLKFGGPLAPRFAQTPDSAPADARELAEAVRSEDFDAIAAFRVREMDRGAVAMTVVMPIDFGAAAATQHWAETEAVAAACRKHADRLVPYLGLDPRRSNALEVLQRAVTELGMKGVKIHPLAGFAIDDRDAMYAFYRKCAELNVPVLGHCRPLGNPARDDLARPERYGKVAADFPGLRIALGHLGGGPWAEEAIRVVEQRPNAYGDLSTWQSFVEQERDQAARLLRRAMDGPARERVVFGTDWPTQRDRDAAFLAALRQGLPHGPDNTPALGQEEVRLILYENPKRFLGL